MDTTIEVEGLGDFVSSLNLLPSVLTVGVASTGDPSNYSLVWEFGSTRIITPGPRTVYGVNGLGDPAIMSSQAPNGYIRINREKFLAAVQQCINKVDWNNLTNLHSDLTDAMNAAAEECRFIVQSSAPVDTGALSISFVVVPVGDEILDTQDPAVMG